MADDTAGDDFGTSVALTDSGKELVVGAIGYRGQDGGGESHVKNGKRKQRMALSCGIDWTNTTLLCHHHPWLPPLCLFTIKCYLIPSLFSTFHHKTVGQSLFINTHHIPKTMSLFKNLSLLASWKAFRVILDFQWQYLVMGKHWWLQLLIIQGICLEQVNQQHSKPSWKV